MQKFENTKITVFLNSKTQSQVIQTWYWKPGSNTNCWKIWFCISYKTHSGSNKHESTSFMRDNMQPWILEQRIESVPWCGEIQNKRLEVLGNNFNLHSNSTNIQEVWSLNQFPRKNKREWLSLIHTKPFHKDFSLSCYLQNSICFSLYI